MNPRRSTLTTATTWTGSNKRMVGQASTSLRRTLHGQRTSMRISLRIHCNTDEIWTLSANSLYISPGIRKHTEGRQYHLAAWQDANDPDRRAQRRSRGAPRGQSSRSLLPKMDVRYRLWRQTRPRCTPTEYINLKTATNCNAELPKLSKIPCGIDQARVFDMGYQQDIWPQHLRLRQWQPRWRG